VTDAIDIYRAPDGSALDVALASEHRSPRSRRESGFPAVPVDDELGSARDDQGSQ
jgi:hypothetical protein